MIYESKDRENQDRDPRFKDRSEFKDARGTRHRIKDVFFQESLRSRNPKPLMGTAILLSNCILDMGEYFQASGTTPRSEGPWARTKLYSQKVKDLASAFATAERVGDVSGDPWSQKTPTPNPEKRIA
ncbi:hypothetical protein E5676_scaffold120G003510 [Cucumis melo var. makuwa]|uniref:Uncharacterized protein n=1 Tax=Cucumis melo var. makuwa TaxID=1194695 RepID=A0A5D3E0E8_CUCMM|nr:hypothetical protein E5676_scaffold120G003510 [Cucumis melo var. makuwa]